MNLMKMTEILKYHHLADFQFTISLYQLHEKDMTTVKDFLKQGGWKFQISAKKKKVGSSKIV